MQGATRCAIQAIVDFVGIVPVDPAIERGTGTPSPQASDARHDLETRLYMDCYVTGGPTPLNIASCRGPERLSRGHVALLEDARANHVTLRRGLELLSRDSDRAEVGVLGIRLSVPIEDVDPPDATVGELVTVTMPNQRRNSSPGFWSVFGRVHPADSYEDSVIRFYWNVSATGAPALVTSVGRHLDKQEVGYRFKLLKDPWVYSDRRDAAVLYVDRRGWPRAREVVAKIYEEVAQALDSGTPLFTKELAPGLGFAEDPVNGQSFGQHRCKILADGLIAGWRSGLTSMEDRMEAIETAFADARIDLDSPYLNPGSVDPTQDLGILESRRPVALPVTSLDVARAIATRVAERATWAADRRCCAWLAAVVVPKGSGVLEMAWASTGTSLSEGTGGIASVLYDVASATGDEELARVAAGASVHAESGATGTPAIHPGGWCFDGRVAAALAALEEDVPTLLEKLKHLGAVADTWLASDRWAAYRAAENGV